MRVLIQGGIFALVFAAVAASGCGDDASSSPDATPPDGTLPAIDATLPPDAVQPDAIVTDGALLEPGATCQNPIVLSAGDSSGADTTLMSPTARGSCAAASSQARDAIFLFDVGQNPVDLLVSASVDEGVGMPFDVVLYARHLCTSSAEEIACSDAGWGESAEFLDVTGKVYVFVDGSNQYGGADEGTFTLASAARDVVATDGSCDMAQITSRCASGNRCVGGTCVADSAALACTEATDITTPLQTTGSFNVTSTTHLYESDFYKGSCPADGTLASPEAIYKLTVSAASTFVATTDRPNTQYDTYLYLRQGTCDGTEVACHDDVDLLNQNLRSTISIADLQPGTYYLFVDGSSPGQNAGQYELNVTLTAN